MTTVLIVGSGPAAAGVALALTGQDDLKITVIDVGVRLESERQQIVDNLAMSDPSEWDAGLALSVSESPVASTTRGVPEKRLYGSDYPFRNVGQLDGVTASSKATASLISGAYGGFSNVWGSQLMPFTEKTFEYWPFGASALQPHYEAILRQIPFAGEDDDLSDLFPLLGRPAKLPPLSPRSQWTLDAYEQNRAQLNRRGITVGKARLAFRADDCVRCGMCMTGCPYGLIYSAAHTFDQLQRSNRITHHSGLMVLRVTEDADRAEVVAQEVDTGRTQRFEADRLFVACGALGSTRLVASSLGIGDVELSMIESQQFVLPFVSLRPTPDPRQESDFTLNQFNMIVAQDKGSVDLSQLHFYTFNSAFINAFPSLLRGRATERIQTQLLRRLTVALGYLPSWRSPRLLVTARAGGDTPGLADLHISRESAPGGRNEMLRNVLARLVQSARSLDLYPVLPMLRLAAGGKSYHIGGSFPHSLRPSTIFQSDRMGRVANWQRIHLVDASVFPTVPAMTFTLTIMANAHRIASESLELMG